ncbi:MAG: ParB/RepB/Spo0J family partition protein [Phycisphaeraceae bacterium]
MAQPVQAAPDRSAASVPEPAKEASVERQGGEAGLRYLPVEALSPNPHQPRQEFDEAALERLAGSIASDGLMQPIVVRPAAGKKERYELVAGERRWRAARQAGLDRVPALVRDLDDRQLAEWALIENLQREDLNPLDRAQAFQGLIEQFELGHDEIAQRVGLERSTISNLLRLLNLDEGVQQMLRRGQLSMGQARALASVEDPNQQLALAERIVREGLSVRQVEQLVRKLASGDAGQAEPSRTRVRSAYLADLEQTLGQQLSTKVAIRPGRKKGSGKMTIEFYSLEHFDQLLEQFGLNVGE